MPKEYFKGHHIFSLKLYGQMLFESMNASLIISCDDDVIDINKYVEACGWWRVHEEDRVIDLTLVMPYS